MDIYSHSIEAEFPNLKKHKYKITSPVSPEYNCIAWVVGDNTKWWWPDMQYIAYWPEYIPREISLDSFIRLFTSLGYMLCEDEMFEKGYEKVAIFIDNTGVPTHTTRQLLNGRWTSKLGKYIDIEHGLKGLTNSSYGKVAQIMKRKRKK